MPREKSGRAAFPTNDGDDNGPDTATAAAAYVLTGEHPCHECGCIVPVFGVMLVRPFEIVGYPEIGDDDAGVVLTYAVDLPERLSTLLTLRSRGTYRVDASKTADSSYWMNHCSECAAKIGDYYLQEVGAAFFPQTAEERGRLKGERIDCPFFFDNPGCSRSTWMALWLQQVSPN